MTTPVDGSFDLSSLGLGVPAATKKTSLGQTDFLNLMMTELKNQDPTKPMDSGAFLGQLAQFGTVSGLQDLQTKFDTLSSSLVSNQALQAASLVGKDALVESTKAPLFPGSAGVDGAVDLPAATSGATVEIRDAQNQVVAHIELGAQPAGLARFEWNGISDSGAQAPPGVYNMVGSYLAGSKSTAATTLVYAPVDSVVLGKDGFTVDVAGVGEVPFSQVHEIGN
jgi:flagellar basal-body rod modification protein FlgD